MTTILELCQRLMQRHCQIADAAADLAALVAEQGQEINLLSALVETPLDEPNNSSTLDQLGGFGFDRGPEPIIPSEMAVHAPSEIPPAHVAAFAPDHAPTPRDIPEGAVMVRPEPLDTPLPHLGGRKKTDMTAQEWALSTHFLAYMKKPPFNDWSAEEQTAKRDAFILAAPQDLRMNRWGARFSKFCGVP